jgi:hypothetical protein
MREMPSDNPQQIPLPDAGLSGENSLMWRAISLVIIGFWLVMSFLLVRYVWFPEGTQFSQVPPAMVLRRFLEQGGASGNLRALHLFHRADRIGFANMSVTRVREDASDYNVRLDGVLEKGTVKSVNERISWTLTLKLVEVDKFDELSLRIRLEPDQPAYRSRVQLEPNVAGLTGKMRLHQSPPTVHVVWKKGQRMPTITPTGFDNMNDQLMQLIMAQALLNAGASPAAPTAGSESIDPGILRIRARGSAMDFAGQKSQGYLLEFTIMDRWKARSFIAEAGEFVLMDLPEGYRIIEPVIHGLAKEYDPDKEQVITSEGDVAPLPAEEGAKK